MAEFDEMLDHEIAQSRSRKRRPRAPANQADKSSRCGRRRLLKRSCPRKSGRIQPRPSSAELSEQAVLMDETAPNRGIFERDPIPYALDTDWPVGAAGFELPHLE